MEKDLQDFAHDAYEFTRLRGAGVRGWRNARGLHRKTTSGEFALVLDEPHPDVVAMLGAGELELEFQAHHDGRVRVALLKHTFLAAWLCCDSDELNLVVMNEVRAELIVHATRPLRQISSPEPWARRLDIRRLTAPPDLPTLVAVVMTGAEGPWRGVVFSRAVGVTWPTEWFTTLPDPDDDA